MQPTMDVAQHYRGMTLYSADGEKIGEIQDIFLDDQTTKPEWVRIGVGLFGRKNILVPIEHLEKQDDGLRAPYPKDMLKDAPSIDENYVSPVEESQLYRYYGLSDASPSELNEERGTPEDGLEQRTPVRAPHGEPPGAAREGSLNVPEEQTLTARGERNPQQVRLRKWIDS